MKLTDLLKKYKGRIAVAVLIIAVLVISWFAGAPLSDSGKGKTSVSDSTATDNNAIAYNDAYAKKTQDGSGTATGDKESDGTVKEETDGDDASGDNSQGSEGEKSTSGSETVDSETVPGSDNKDTDAGGSGSSQGGAQNPGRENGPTPTVKATATPTPVPAKTPTNTPTPAASDKNDSYKHHGTTGSTYSCTIEIDCSTVLDELDDSISPKLKKIIPEDGKILKTSTVYFGEGDNVFNALCQAGILYFTDDNFIEYQYTPLYKNYYVEGIAGLYEFDFGNLSGWTYYVNGEWAKVGCSQYELKDGDHILWKYVTSYSDSDMS